jgi:capsular polysaccharide biosynthesis protein
MGELLPRRRRGPAGVGAAAFDGSRDLLDSGDGRGVDFRPGPLTVLARHPILVALAAAVCGVAAYAVSTTQTNRYEATGRLFLVDPNSTLELDFARTTYVDPRRNARTRAEIARSMPVLERAARSLGVPVDDVRDRVDAVPSRESDVVTITASADSPTEAARLVTLVQEGYRDVTLSREHAPFRRAIAELDRIRLETEQRLLLVGEELAAQPGSPTLLEERSFLRRHLQTIRNREAALRSNSALLGTGVQLFERAEVPEAPISPRPLRTALVAGLFGAFGAVAVLWWRAARNPPVNDPESAQAVLGAPVVADLRSFFRWSSLRGPGSSRAEEYRRLTHALSKLLDERVRVIHLTAARTQDLQAAIALRAAGGIAMMEHRVAVVDGDRHKRRLSRYLRTAGATGLTDLERDAPDPAVELVQLRIAGSPPIAFLPAGMNTARLQALEGAGIYRAALTALAGSFDVIVANGPALVSLRETAPGAQPEARTLVLCGSATTVRELTDLRGRLELLDLTAVGIVFERSGRLERLLRRWFRGAGGRSRSRMRRARGNRRMRLRRRASEREGEERTDRSGQAS